MGGRHTFQNYTSIDNDNDQQTDTCVGLQSLKNIQTQMRLVLFKFWVGKSRAVVTREREREWIERCCFMPFVGSFLLYSRICMLT